MKLTDSFTLPVSVDRMWEVLTDVELIAPCVPGFKLKEVDEPEYRGAMTIKVGAVSVTYDATITFVERDDEGRRAVLAVAGKEKRGGGRVNADVTATLSGDETQTTADMVTDVQVTGKVAQFGRGIIADVGSRLTGQFVDNLNERVLVEQEPAVVGEAPRMGEAPPASEEAPTSAADAQSSSSNGSPASPSATAPGGDDVLDLGATAFAPILKRVAPVAVLVLLVLLVLRRRGR